jgi:RpiB/LacA/LacB family sugar-phosphate isomerase
MNADLIHKECLTLKTTKVVDIASDHGGHELKEYLVKMPREAGAAVIDFGDHKLEPEDDYPDFFVALARAVASGQVCCGVVICGSGVGVCDAANKMDGVRACLGHDPLSAHKIVEDDDINLLCLGGLVMGHALARDLVPRLLTAHSSGEERHRRRLAKVSELENQHSADFIAAGDSSDEAETPKFYLIRHGETEWTFSNRHTGVTHIPLTALGEDEVQEWGHRFCGIHFPQILTSPRQRARQTCELVVLGEAAEIEEDLAEWNYGDYEGLQSTEIRKGGPDWNLFRDGCPNVESPDQVSARADRLISRLRWMKGNTAIFPPGQLGGVLAARWIGLSVIEAQHFPPGTASLGIFGNDPHHPEVRVIELWNLAPHEAGRPAPAHHACMSMKQRAIQRWENEGGEIPDAKPTDASAKASP